MKNFKMLIALSIILFIVSFYMGTTRVSMEIKHVDYYKNVIVIEDVRGVVYKIDPKYDTGFYDGQRIRVIIDYNETNRLYLQLVAFVLLVVGIVGIKGYLK